VASPTEAVRDELAGWLSLWKNNHTAFQQTGRQSPILKDIVPLSKNLSEVAQIGSQALEYIHTRKSPPASWVESSKKLLEEAKKPQAKCELRIVEGIEKLVNLTAKAQ
jgi:hexosaminidase